MVKCRRANRYGAQLRLSGSAFSFLSSDRVCISFFAVHIFVCPAVCHELKLGNVQRMNAGFCSALQPWSSFMGSQVERNISRR